MKMGTVVYSFCCNCCGWGGEKVSAGGPQKGRVSSVVVRDSVTKMTDIVLQGRALGKNQTLMVSCCEAGRHHRLPKWMSPSP